jgi:hypothetical protein
MILLGVAFKSMTDNRPELRMSIVRTIVNTDFFFHSFNADWHNNLINNGSLTNMPIEVDFSKNKIYRIAGAELETKKAN